MNKKFYLGAILLGAMTLSTGALTSCIDNDEPEGITNLRGAKAELLRAKAAVELAKAETEKQNANWVAALAAIDQARAKQEEAKAKQEEAKVAYEQAKAAYEQALAEQQKAEALKQMAYAQQAQADAEAQIAAIKAENEVYLLMQKKLLLEAQNNYDKLVAEIEAAKAVLTDAQAKKLGNLQAAVDYAWSLYTAQQSAVLTAMDEFFKATNEEVDKEETLRDALAKAQAKLEAVNAAYGELKALSENVAPTAWESRMDELKAYGDKTNGTYKLEIAELELKKKEIKQSEAYKTAFVEDTTARRAYITAQQLYNYLADGKEKDCFTAGEDHEGVSDEGNLWGYEYPGTHPSQKPYTEAKKYDLKGAEIVITNPDVYKKLAALFTTPAEAEAAGLFKDQQGNMGLKVAETLVADGNGEPYSKLEHAFIDGKDQSTITSTVAGWEAALAKVKVTDEEISADNCVADYEKAVEEAQKAHDAAVKTWEAMHKQYQTGVKAVEVSTDGIKKAMEAYNTAHAALVSKVEAYNAKFDEVANAAATKYLNDNYKWPAQNAVYVAKAAAIGLTIGTGVTINIPASAVTLADCDAYITSLNSVITAASSDWDAAKVIAKIKADADFINAYEDSYTVAQRESNATTAKNNGITAAQDNADVAKAKTEYLKAEAALRINADNKLAALVKAFEETDKGYYDKLTAAAQEVTSALALDYYVLEGTKTVKNNALENVKYPVANNKVGEEAGDFGSTSTIVVDAVKQDAKGEKWEAVANHVMVATTGIDIDAALKAAEGKLVPALAEAAWKTASAKAFGSGNANPRHTELTTALINWSTTPISDENGNALINWAGSSLEKLVDAKQTLANHQNLQGVNAEIASLKEKVAAAKAAIQEQIAGYTKAVNEAKAAIEPAKKEHQAKHKAAEALLQPVKDEIKKIEAKAKEYRALAGKLQDILNAYYDINVFSYVNEKGETQSIDWSTTTTTDKDFSQIAAWLKSELAKYEKNDTSDGAPADSEGKIKDAEAAVADAQKKLDRWIADGEFDAVAEKQLALDQAQAYLETLKARYDFALSQLNDYVAALSK